MHFFFKCKENMGMVCFYMIDLFYRAFTWFFSRTGRAINNNIHAFWLHGCTIIYYFFASSM